MELEKTLRKARNALIGIGLSGALMLGSGCETFLYSAAQGAGREAGKEVVQDLVRQSKEEQQKKQEQVQGLRTDIFACNYFKDFNNNGFSDYPDEFVGIKNRFRDNEKILLVSYDRKSKKGQVARMQLYNPSGKLISELSKFLESNGGISGMNLNSEWAIQNSGYGNFKYVYYLDNKYVGSTEFEIVPSK